MPTEIQQLEWLYAEERHLSLFWEQRYNSCRRQLLIAAIWAAAATLAVAVIVTR